MIEMKPTPGPLVPHDREKVTSIPLKAIDCERLGISVCFVNGHRETEAKANAILIYEAFNVHHDTGLSPVQLVERVKELEGALIRAKEAINSMKVEAETAAQGDEQMMLEARETISNEGLDADMEIRDTLSKSLPNAAAKEAGVCCEGSADVKIIKQGKLPEEKIHRETCGHCKSELEFKHSEVLWSPDPRDGALWFVICPVCTRHVWGRSK